MPDPANRRSHRQLMRQTARLAGALAIISMAGLAARAEAAVWQMQHQVYIGGVTVLHVDTRLTLEGDRYQMQVSARTDGFVGRMVSWKIESGSSGVMTASGLRPEQHQQDGEFRGKARSMRLEYQQDGTIRVEAVPDTIDENQPKVPEELRLGTRDAITSILDALISAGRADGACGGLQAVFDGRRRYDIELIDRGPARLGKSDYSSYSGEARMCQTRYHPRMPPPRRSVMAGFWKRDSDSSQRPPMDVWLATAVAGAPVVPVRIESDSGFGAMVAHLKGMEQISP